MNFAVPSPSFLKYVLFSGLLGPLDTDRLIPHFSKMPPRCQVCNNFERKTRDYRVAWDCTPSQLDSASDQGCQVCSLILKGVQNFSSRLGGLECINRFISIEGPTLDQLGDANLEVVIFPNEQSSRTQSLRLEFFPTGESG